MSLVCPFCVEPLIKPKPVKRPRGRPKSAIDRKKVAAVLRATGGSVRKAAVALRIPRSTLGRFVAKELSRGRWRKA